MIVRTQLPPCHCRNDHIVMIRRRNSSMNDTIDKFFQPSPHHSGTTNQVMKTSTKPPSGMVVATIMILLSCMIALSSIDTNTQVSLFTLAYIIPKNLPYHHHHQQQDQFNAKIRNSNAATFQHRPWLLERRRIWKCRNKNISGGSGCNSLHHHRRELPAYTTSKRGNTNVIRCHPFTPKRRNSNSGVWMMNANESNGDEESSNAPFYASTSLPSTPNSSGTNSSTSTSSSNNGEVNAATKLTATSTNSRRPTSLTTTSSTSDDPVLAVADSFVDVFASFGKLFSNMFSNNKNENNVETIRGTAVDATTTTSVPSKVDTSKEEPITPLLSSTEPNSTIPSIESTSIPSSTATFENIDGNSDKKTSFMNDIVASLLMDEQQGIMQPQQASVAFESSETATATTVSAIATTETTTNLAAPIVSDTNEYGHDEDDDDDPFHMTYRDDSDSITIDYDVNEDDIVLSSNPTAENTIDPATDTSTQNDDTLPMNPKQDDAIDSADKNAETIDPSDEIMNSNDNNVIVQEVNGWVTTTTASTFSDEDDDGGVVVVYDVDELDGWNQPLSPIESTSKEDDNSRDTITSIAEAPIELEAMTFTMTPSTDPNDYFDENGNEITMTEAEADDMGGVSINTSVLDTTIGATTSIIDDSDDDNVDATKDVAMLETLSTFPTTPTSSVEEDKEFKLVDGETIEASDGVGNDADDVAIVYDIDELDSWNMGDNDKESGFVPFDATTLTITEVNADDDESDFVESVSTEKLNETFDDVVIRTVDALVGIDDDSDDDAFSEEDWQASVQMAQQSMSEKISGMMIDFDDLPKTVDEKIDNKDKFDRESAEQVATLLNDTPPLKTTDSSSTDSDIDMEALAKAARDAVEMFEQKFETERQDTQRQREQWTTQQLSVSDSVDSTRVQDVAVPQSLADMEVKWNKMTLSELKNELGSRGLSTSGTKAKLVSRLVDQQSLTTMEKEGKGIVQSDASTSDHGLRDWTTLKVAELKAELNRRGLPTIGKKADLVALLTDSDVALQSIVTTKPNIVVSIESDLINPIVNKNIDEVAKAAREAVAMFEQTNGSIDDTDDFDDIYESTDDMFDEDEDISVDDFDLEALGKAARNAVLHMESDEDEPSDEALWEIENEIALVDESFLPPDDEIEQLSMMIGNIDSLKDNTTPNTQGQSDPPPNYASMAVSQLKEELNQRGLRVTGKKIDLIARLEASDNESR